MVADGKTIDIIDVAMIKRWLGIINNNLDNIRKLLIYNDTPLPL